MVQVDYYQVLRVTASASKDEIIASYRKLCKMYHPDVNRSPGAEERMKQINVAYYELRDEARRREHDRQLRFRTARAQQPSQSPPQPPPKTQPPPPRPPAPEPREQPRAEKAAPQERSRPFSGFGQGSKKEEKPPRQAGGADQAEEAAQAERATAVVREYFNCLREDRHENAYQLLCRQDREAVSLRDFCKWRSSVGGMFHLEAFSIDGGEPVGGLKSEAGVLASARRYRITVTEFSRAEESRERHQCVKYTFPEGGEWKIFLGYRDLSVIARAYDDLSRRRQQTEMSRRYEEYCRQNCREIEMFTMEGLLKEARREIYRCRRYGQVMTVACYNVSPRPGAPQEEVDDIVACCAKIFQKELRMTDIPAYIGKGLFVVLLVELKKRSAAMIIGRMAERMQKEVWSTLGVEISPKWAWAPYEGGALKPYIDNLPGRVGARV